MKLCYCEKCNKFFADYDAYDEILIAKKIGAAYEMQNFCQECGKKMHEAINGLLNESEDKNNG